ncbi:MAG TPA: cytochrome ubiquinol oxidase subunit I, partial [Armatimonadota bacterium]
EFQFGTNWSKYSKFVGDIFGAPLAIETISAFFLESVFLGLVLFGWDRLSRNAHCFATFMVAVGSTLSAFWIIVANSWMQTPAAYILRNGRAELTSFWGAVFNASTMPRFLHTVDGAIMTGAFFMLGISAWFLFKKQHVSSARVTFLLALVVAQIASVVQLGLGHYHAVQVVNTQPAKLAAIEGLFTTQAHAPLLLFGIPDAERGTVDYAVRIPGGLSMLAYGKPAATVTGLDAFPRAQWPPIPLTFYPFHLMVVIGFMLIGFPALGLLLLWMKKLYTNRLYLVLAMLAVPLPFLANELGWMTAEVGRQPWIVYQVLATSDAVSVTVPRSNVIFSMVTLGLVYAMLFAIWILVLRREIRRGPEAPTVMSTAEVVR